MWILLGIAAVILSLIYPAVAVIIVVAFIGYNVVRLVVAIREETAISGLIINGTCVIAGVAILIWAFTR